MPYDNAEKKKQKKKKVRGNCRSTLDGHISDDGLQQLSDYKYKSSSYSPLDLLLNACVWEPFVTAIPHFVSPNLVTFVGLLCMLPSFFIVFLFAPALDEECPSYIYLAFLVSAFV